LLLYKSAGKERDSDRSHFPGIGSPNNSFSRVLFQGAENGVVLKGSALDNQLVAQRGKVRDTNHFGKHIFHDRSAKTSHNIFRAFPVLLFGNDAAVHEYSAPTSQFSRVPGVESYLRYFGNVESEGFCKVF
jgi:hypothetical protein